MQNYFYERADELIHHCRNGEVLLLDCSGEDSDFIRLNHSLVRQAGTVRQRYLSMELIDGSRHARDTIPLTGRVQQDRERAEAALESLRDLLPHLPEDPYLLYSTDVRNTEQIGRNDLSSPAEAIDALVATGRGADLVGIFAQGGMYRGFANSLGQRNWFASHSFHFEWSFYAHDDKAVKSSYAGFVWSPDEFDRKLQSARAQLQALQQPARTIDPGEYRVYLAPWALKAYLETVAMRGFGAKLRKTRRTSLLRMLEGQASLHPSVSLKENTRDGLAPNFTSAGFIKPDHVPLLREGKLADALVSPRSAKEYHLSVNAGSEYPASLDLAPGTLDEEEIPAQLGEGVWANQLWYLNYSDAPACRITGMTRFATFWVENGELVAPLNVMRFDETAYRVLGEHLLALTQAREFFPDEHTYGSRSTRSTRLPGALVDRFRFTL